MDLIDFGATMASAVVDTSSTSTEVKSRPASWNFMEVCAATLAPSTFLDAKAALRSWSVLKFLSSMFTPFFLSKPFS